jgi:hypothetical protein
MKFLFPVVAAALAAAAGADDECTSSYTQLPHGQTPYENDGGCFFCAKFSGSTFPISDLGDLADNCKQMCDNDPECTAFEIARQASLHAHEYWWGTAANCCLQREEEYPEEIFINAQSIGGDEPNTCEKEIMCWSRYEKNTGASSCDKKPKKSKLCEPIWKAKKFTDEKIQQHIDFIKNGCDYKDKKFLSMLDDAYQQCKAEIEAEPQQVQQQTQTQQSSFSNTDRQRSAWVAHGVFGAITFGILAPLSAFSPSFPSFIPTEAYTAIHIATFVLTFVTVLIAFKTKNGLGDNYDSHAKETHQIVGLTLLLLVCLQTLGSIHREDKISYKLITGAGLIIFGFGAYEVESGCFLYATNYDAVDWGQVYLGYIGWLLLVIVGGFLAMKYRGGKRGPQYSRVQMKAFELQ